VPTLQRSRSKEEQDAEKDEENHVPGEKSEKIIQETE
jgi:hypothetical protein